MSGPAAGEVPIRPFTIAIPDEQIADLARRIDAARWPAPSWQDAADWSYGMPEPVLRELAAYWRIDFDWGAAEARINAVPQGIATIDGLDLHFLHARSPHENAMPLLLVHGWPGSIVEFLGVIPRLTHPERFGGRSEQAFHVVCPSLPGYAYSQLPQESGMAPDRIAVQHAALMRLLGYERFVAQGGDWGALCCRYLPETCPENLVGLHLNLTLPLPPQGLADPDAALTPDERAFVAAWHAAEGEMTGYSHLQATKPQTLAYGLSDSPLGLAAWIGEKLHGWSHHSGDLREVVSWDDLLTNVALYWFTNSIGSSIRLYREYALAMAQGRAPAARCSVPTGLARYPGEYWKQPRSWAEIEYNVVHWYEAPRGGHFAALEQPDLFAADLRAFLGVLRGGQ